MNMIWAKILATTRTTAFDMSEAYKKANFQGQIYQNQSLDKAALPKPVFGNTNYFWSIFLHFQNKQEKPLVSSLYE